MYVTVKLLSLQITIIAVTLANTVAAVLAVKLQKKATAKDILIIRRARQTR